jgi:O-antigen ligase
MKAGVINYRYDAMRLVSMKAGLMVWGQDVLMGVGAGDLSAAMNDYYAQSYPQLDEQNRLLPHHQFIWVLASLGLVGLVSIFDGVLCAFFRKWQLSSMDFCGVAPHFVYVIFYGTYARRADRHSFLSYLSALIHPTV